MQHFEQDNLIFKIVHKFKIIADFFFLNCNNSLKIVIKIKQ